MKGYINTAIVESKDLGSYPMDVFTRLMADRIIFVGTEIDDDVANIIQAQLLYLDSVSQEDITMYINSPGGLVTAGLGIYDTMKMIKSRVHTVCTGMAASMGAILLVAGDTRSILPHSKVMIHQPWGGTSGQASDMLIAAKEIEKTREILCDIIAEHSHQDRNKVFADMDRDHWMTAAEALEYGIVDEVLTPELKHKYKK